MPSPMGCSTLNPCTLSSGRPAVKICAPYQGFWSPTAIELKSDTVHRLNHVGRWEHSSGSRSLKLLLLFYASVMNTQVDIFMKTIYTRRYMYMYLLILTNSPNFFLLPCLDLVCCATSFSYSSQASACSSIASLFASKANLPYKQSCTGPYCLYFQDPLLMTLWVI